MRLFIVIVALLFGALAGFLGGGVLLGALAEGGATGPYPSVVMGLSVACGAAVFLPLGLALGDFEERNAAVGPARQLITVAFGLLGAGAGLAAFAVLSAAAGDLGPSASKLFAAFLILVFGFIGLQAGRRIAASQVY